MCVYFHMHNKAIDMIMRLCGIDRGPLVDWLRKWPEGTNLPYCTTSEPALYLSVCICQSYLCHTPLCVCLIEIQGPQVCWPTSKSSPADTYHAQQGAADGLSRKNPGLFPKAWRVTIPQQILAQVPQQAQTLINNGSQILRATLAVQTGSQAK